jgi:hypothetical protein
MVCTDFHENKKINIEMFELECTKLFLLTAAIRGDKIAVCEINDRENVLSWIEKEMPNKANFMLRLKSTAALTISGIFFDIGRDYDRLRK